ncbi:MAG: PEGA domain-containing protein [Acidobacteriota bacterium]|nr:PEGA domain-containing protein [Acidobacteriota bacterium]
MAHSETKSLVRRAIFLAVLLALLMLTLPACVSVQKTGENAPPSEAQFAMVQFNSVKDPAEVYVDSQFRGSTPVSLQLTAGTHSVEIKLAGYQPWLRELMVVAGDDTRVTAVLQPK